MDSFNSLAEEIVRRLKSNAKLPSLYQQLELLGPLLEAKYGGRLSMNRLQFVQGENHCCLHARMPYEFYEGAYATWTELSRRESTELRKYLIELLTQWINTDREEPPVLPPNPSFRETFDRIESEFESTGKDELQQFFERRWRCFESAFRIVTSMETKHAAIDLSTLMQFESLKRDNRLWKKWPYEDKFFTFSSYRYTSNSALGVATRFAESIHNSVIVGRLEALKNFSADLDDEQVLAWWSASRKQAQEVTLDFDKWSIGATYRDRDILTVLVHRELLQAKPAEAKKRLSLKAPAINLSDKKLLLAMLELGLHDGVYESSAIICAKAGRLKAHKKLFDRIIAAQLVTVPPNSQGRTLTEKGFLYAKTLTEQK